MAFARRAPLFTSSRVSVALTKASAYPRTEHHLSHQSVKGGLLSVGAVLLALILLVSELREFLSTTHSHSARPAAALLATRLTSSCAAAGRGHSPEESTAASHA